MLMAILHSINHAILSSVGLYIFSIFYWNIYNIFVVVFLRRTNTVKVI